MVFSLMDHKNNKLSYYGKERGKKAERQDYLWTNSGPGKTGGSKWRIKVWVGLIIITYGIRSKSICSV